MKHYIEHKIPAHIEEHIRRELDKVTCDHCGKEIPQEEMYRDLDETTITRRHGFVCEEDAVETDTYDICEDCFKEYILPLFVKKKRKTPSERTTRIRGREELKHLLILLKSLKEMGISSFEDFNLRFHIPVIGHQVRMKIHRVLMDSEVTITERKLNDIARYTIFGADKKPIAIYDNVNIVDMQITPLNQLHFVGEAQVWWNEILGLLITAFELIVKKDERS